MLRFASSLLLGFAVLIPTDLIGQTGGGCTTSSLTGTYFYVLSGNTASRSQILPYAELGTLKADGSGNISGNSTASIGGVLYPFSISGVYSVQANCTGTLSETVTNTTLGASQSTLTFQVVLGGYGALVAFSSSGGVLTGQGIRAANAGGTGCTNGFLSGSYGYLLEGTQAVSGSTYLYSDAGEAIFDGKGNLTSVKSVANIGAGSTQISGTGTYSLTSNCFGYARVVSDNGTSNFKIAVGQGKTILFMETDSGSTVSGIAEPQEAQVVLPQFVFGGGWYTALYFTNTNADTVSFGVNFTNNSGTSLSIPSLAASSTQITLPGQGTAIIEAVNSGPLNEGYATFTLRAGVTGYGVFRQSVAGVPDQEAVVPFSNAAATSNTLTFDETAYTTGVAIVNPSGVDTTVAISVMDTNGNLLGTSSVDLSALNKTASVLSSLPGLAGMKGHRGSAQFTVSQGNVAVLGLRFNGTAFTSIPAVLE